MSNSQYLTPELRDWVAAQLRNGITREALYQAMLTSGWQPDMAQQALAEHRPFEPPLTLPELPEPAIEPGSLPEPDLTDQRSVLLPDGHRVEILMALQRPRVIVFGNLLSAQECDAMVAAAGARLARSETVAAQREGSEVNSARTSEGMFFERGENEVVARIAEELNSQYVMAYASPRAADGKYHSIRVRVLRPGFKVRARNGYVGTAKPGSLQP